MGQLLVALDVDSGASALELATQLRGLAGGFKVGSRLFTAEGPTLVRRLVETGSNVFLDLKFHDIPNTVAQAVDAAVSTGVWMLNVHASGGVPMMQAAARAGADAAARDGRRRPLVIGVTVLTSMDDATLRAIGVHRPLLEQVVTLARMAQDAGLDGVVASPQETAAIRSACGPDFSIVTPGIRGASAGSDRNDQSRTMGPAEAVQAGASYIVVGRPIIAATDPRSAAAAIAEELGRLKAAPTTTSP
jgi:orotidine-5'-phosphate decarboxylase